MIYRTFFLLLFFILVITPVTSNAALKLIEDRLKIGIDITEFPEIQKKRYRLFQEKCSQHHGLYRPITAIKTGKTPVTEKPFGKTEIKKYLIKMMRKPNSGVDRDSAKEIILFLNFLLEKKGNIKEIKEK